MRRVLLLSLLCSACASSSSGTASDARQWRYERIALPPEFAPTLPYQGTEELLFSPGMFKASEPDFFSYVFLLKLNDPPTPTKESLESFLKFYFEGLMTAVAKGRKLNLDLSGMTFEVSKSEAGWKARAQIVDAFVTEAPVILSIEIQDRSQDGQTCWGFLVSPEPSSSSIWEKMRAKQNHLKCQAENLFEDPKGYVEE